MIVGAPPLQMGQQVWSLLGSGPGSTSQRCHPMSDGQIYPLDESGVQPSRETLSLQADFEICQCPQAHHVRDMYQLASSVAFFHLTIDQARRHLPLTQFPPSTMPYEPLSEMGRQRIEIQVETIAREEWEAVRRKERSQGVDEQVRRMLCARTQMQHGHKLGARIDSQPQPEHLCGAAEPGSNFVQLQVREVQVAEAALMEDLSVPAARE